jgi:hypothetical protein
VVEGAAAAFAIHVDPSTPSGVVRTKVGLGTDCWLVWLASTGLGCSVRLVRSLMCGWAWSWGPVHSVAGVHIIFSLGGCGPGALCKVWLGRISFSLWVGVGLGPCAHARSGVVCTTGMGPSGPVLSAHWAGAQETPRALRL